MKILVTGCAGFLGLHLCNEIFKNRKNYNVVGIDNLNDYYSVSYKRKRLSQKILSLTYAQTSQ
tara:strand:- start:110 stop:298 length:189 start_codon:yes stop_codon:yes gene_type:complete